MCECVFVCVCVGLDGSASRLPLLRPTTTPHPPSVGLVLAVVGPASAHGRHHDGVHVEPGLTQRRREGLAQAALQHVEERLTHHLKGRRPSRQTTQNREEKKRGEKNVIRFSSFSSEGFFVLF